MDWTKYISPPPVSHLRIWLRPNITQTTVDLSWTDNGTTAWEIVLDVTGFDPDVPTPSSVTENPTSWTGLIENTTYDWYIRTSCGTGNTSEWIGPNTFTTTCIAPSDLAEANITQTTVDLSWTDNGTTAWKIVLDVTGFDLLRLHLLL